MVLPTLDAVSPRPTSHRRPAPLVGLPGRRLKIGRIDGFSDNLSDLDVDVYFADYARGVVRAGGLPVHLPIDTDPADWVERLDAVVLTGGADVDPRRYGAENTASIVEPSRDAFELALLAAAVDLSLPVLGICRGLQVLNVHAGGTLHQDVPPHARFDLAPAAAAHEVEIRPGTELAGIYGERATVNSLHHQMVDRPGDGLVVAATSPDGGVEGLELPGADVIAVQWHPEMMRVDDPVFAWIVERALARRAARHA